VTQGVNKNSLMSGDSYVPQPTAKVEQPKPAAAPAPAPVVVRPRVRTVPPREAKAAEPPAPARPRDAVEMIEGAKKRNVEFPY
jgi:hypothetical protein